MAWLLLWSGAAVLLEVATGPVCVGSRTGHPLETPVWSDTDEEEAGLSRTRRFTPVSTGGVEAAITETEQHYYFDCPYSVRYWKGVISFLLDKLGVEAADAYPGVITPEKLKLGLPELAGRKRNTLKWMWVRLACGIGFAQLHLIRWRSHQAHEEGKELVFPPSVRALRIFQREFLSREFFVPGARDTDA